MPKSNAYGSPVKIFEYALSAKPCIVPNTSPVTEVFEHGQDGWVVDSRLNAIVSAIESILDSPQEGRAVCPPLAQQSDLKTYVAQQRQCGLIQAQ